MAKNKDKLEEILGNVSEDEAIVAVLKKELPENKDSIELRRQLKEWREAWNKNGKGRRFASLYDVVLRNWGSNGLIVKTLIDKLSIWFPIKLYNRLPVVLPYVRRVPGCCPDKKIGRPDTRAWPEVGSGICSDDNSQIKELRLLGPVKSPVNDKHLGKISSGYTACHIWQKVLENSVDGLSEERHACNIPVLNSFVPNLVWLPKSVAIWSDVENSFAQNYLKLLSYERFAFNGSHCKGLQSYVDAIWDLLPGPIDMEVELPEMNQLAEFDISDKVVASRIKNIETVICGLQDSLNQEIPSRKILRMHYTIDNIRNRVAKKRIEELMNWLRMYYSLLNDGGVTNIEELDPILPCRRRVDGVERRNSEMAQLKFEMDNIGEQTQIELFPRDDAEFRRILMERKIAKRELIYSDDRREVGFWRVRSLSLQSGIMRNIQSANFWRSRKKTGLKKVVVSVC